MGAQQATALSIYARRVASSTAAEPVRDPASRVTWLGHATCVIELGGVTLVTDPALTPRLAHLRRHHRPGQDTLPRPDVVLVSHLHLDHLHLPSLRLLGPDLHVVVPRGGARLLRRSGAARVTEVVAGDSLEVAGVTVQVVPAVHGARRWPVGPAAADAVGYLVGSGAESVYFAGDTDLFDGMSDLGPVDVALLPVGGWWRTLGPGHLDPAGAARATEVVAPRIVVPIHWGTYSPWAVRRGEPAWLRRPAEAFGEELRLRGLGGSLRVVDPGGRVEVAGRP
jgi:L-ascorbate metabolism protein UlaG (beta-lactamase superfamily)